MCADDGEHTFRRAVIAVEEIACCVEERLNGWELLTVRDLAPEMAP